MTLKATLRKEALQRRKTRTPEEMQQLSQALADAFFQHFDLTNVRCLHVFLPMLSRNELDTWRIIHRLWQEHPHVKVAVPVTHRDAEALSHHLLTPETELSTSDWGITEPVGSPAVPEQEIDLVLVPLLVFDEQGHRVGYGKGYYDRFLARCRADVQTVGLAAEPPVAAITDVHPQDVPLQYVLTPEQLYQFR